MSLGTTALALGAAVGHAGLARALLGVTVVLHITLIAHTSVLVAVPGGVASAVGLARLASLAAATPSSPLLSSGTTTGLAVGVEDLTTFRADTLLLP